MRKVLFPVHVNATMVMIMGRVIDIGIACIFFLYGLAEKEIVHKAEYRYEWQGYHSLPRSFFFSDSNSS